MSRPSGGSHRWAIQWALIAALAAVAVVYFVQPGRAQAPQPWATELWAMEEGEVLVAVAYARNPTGDELVPALTVLCGNHLRLRFDPGQDDGGVDWTGQSAPFEFDFGDARIERELVYEALDGNWTTTLAPGDNLLAALEGSSSVTVLMRNDGLPANTFSLSGSTAAIREVERSC